MSRSGFNRPNWNDGRTTRSDQQYAEAADVDSDEMEVDLETSESSDKSSDRSSDESSDEYEEEEEEEEDKEEDDFNYEVTDEEDGTHQNSNNSTQGSSDSEFTEKETRKRITILQRIWIAQYMTVREWQPSLDININP